MDEEITATEIKDEWLEKYYDHVTLHPDHRSHHIKPYDVVLPKTYLAAHQVIQDFEVFEDDVFVCTFPKSGLYFFSFYVTVIAR